LNQQYDLYTALNGAKIYSTWYDYQLLVIQAVSSTTTVVQAYELLSGSFKKIFEYREDTIFMSGIFKMSYGVKPPV
jgi:hypothetical protein